MFHSMLIMLAIGVGTPLLARSAYIAPKKLPIVLRKPPMYPITPPPPRKAPITLSVIGMFSSDSVVTESLSLPVSAFSQSSLSGFTLVVNRLPSTFCGELLFSEKLLYMMLSAGASVITRFVPYHANALSDMKTMMIW